MRPPDEIRAALLERYPDFRPFRDSDASGPTGAVIRRDELLVLPQPLGRVGAVEDRIRRWVDRRRDDDELGMARFRLRGGVDVAEMLDDLGRDGAPQAHPVHLFRGEPWYHGGPAAGPARPEAPPPAPHEQTEQKERQERQEQQEPGIPPTATAPVVGVLDTGLTAGHPWFPAGRWRSLGGDVTDVVDADSDWTLDTQAGHGTFVAGVVRQHAPDATLLVGRVLDSFGVCDEVALATAIRRALTGSRVDVLNLSLGTYTYDDKPPVALLGELRRRGRTEIVACAGNAGSDRPFWPAALDDVVAVGATEGSRRAPWSNHGPWVDAWAPGRATSAFVTFDGPAPARDGSDPDRFEGFASWEGTSFAAPVVAARLAGALASARADVLAEFAAPGGADGAR